MAERSSSEERRRARRAGARRGENKCDVCFDTRGGATNKDGAETKGGDSGLDLAGMWLR
jgi:hypothetical protein